MSERWRVIIGSGGFGGLRAARALRSASVDLTLIDRRNHHLFQRFGRGARLITGRSAADFELSKEMASHRRTRSAA